MLGNGIKAIVLNGSHFSQHRKLGYRVILIAQFDRMLDRQIRSVLEYEYIHRKVRT